MCGRYEFILSKEALVDHYNIQHIDETVDFEPREEVFPSQWCPVILPEQHLSQFKWGLDEPWAKRAIINTRLETADTKKTTAKAFHEQRCIIPVSGFYEWDDAKTKFYFEGEGSEIVSLAGLYKIYKDDSGESYAGFSIITKPANAFVSSVHERMPVVLTAGFTDRYLDLTSNVPALKKSLLLFDTPLKLTAVG